MPINILILSTHATSERLSTLLLEQTQVAAQHVSSLTELEQHLANAHPDLILVHSAAQDLHSIAADFSCFLNLQHYPPIIFIADHISEPFGSSLIEQGFADYISIAELSAETLLRSMRLAQRTQQLTAKIEYLKNFDSLTAIQNRYSFCRFLQQQITLHQPLALIIIDIDDFKAFNYRMGHAAGDQVLQELCARIQSCTQQTPVYRIGGDEFALVIHASNMQLLTQKTEALLQKLSLALHNSFELNGHENILGTSMGVVYSDQETQADILINQANQARARAKRMHSCSFSIFEPELDSPPPYQGLLESDIWTALKLNQFELYYQPRINLRTGNIVGAEALMRWNHPEHGLIMPNDFIPISEHTGQIVPMGFWAIQQAGRDLKKIKESGFQISKLGVNLSFRQFRHERLAQTIQRIVEAEQIDTTILELELTESSLFSEDQHAQHSIEQLCKLGIDFSLDDFGTGYSSFSLLQRLPISALKIDRSFIDKLPDSAGDAEIVRAIISLAHNLNKSVIAEGVETQAQLDFLIEHECDQVQGFLFSKPVPLANFLNMLRTE